MKTINEAIELSEFETMLEENENLIVDLFAEWCQPCQDLHGILEEIEKDNSDLTIVSINIEENDWIAMDYEVTTIPQLLFFKNGEKVQTFSGCAPRKLIEAYIENAFNGKSFFNEISSKSKEELEKAIKADGKAVILPYSPSDDEKMEMFNQLTPYFLEIFSNKIDIKFRPLNIDENEEILADYADLEPLIGLFYNNGELKGKQGVYSPDLLLIGILEFIEGKNPIVKKSNISYEEFEELTSKGNSVVIFTKENGFVNLLVKPFIYRLAKDLPDLPFYAIDYDKNSWIDSELGIDGDEYGDFNEEGKKTPYFMFIKDGEIIKECGPIEPDAMLSTVKGDILDLFNVEDFPEGISEEDFEKILKENPKVVVDAYTVWCGPCKAMKPIFLELSGDFTDVKFISINFDEAPWLGDDNHYEFDAIPTFLLFKDGELAHKQIGGLPKPAFEELIKEHLE